jgi:hemerythrin superfamily protein
MKVKKLIRKLYKACIEHNKEEEKRLWRKALKKSLKHKHTEAIK